MKRFSVIGVFASSLVFAAASASVRGQAPAFGLDSESSVVLTAWELQPTNSTATWAENDAGFRYATTGAFGGAFRGGVALPNGARITRIELEACDNSIEGGVSVALDRNSTATALVTVPEDTAGTPGCGRFGAALPVPETVDNSANRYFVTVAATAYDASVSFGAVRVYYELQVSPAPATATFLDVPTSDPAFQFVEALAAAGITAGCGSGNFCPDNPLTRRQMAVFLSKALGLHWGESAAP